MNCMTESSIIPVHWTFYFVIVHVPSDFEYNIPTIIYYYVIILVDEPIMTINCLILKL